MTHTFSKLKTVSAFALITALISSPAFAQDSERRGATDILQDEVITTATKKTNVENVTDVPVSVTSFGAESLEALKVRDLQSLSFSAPNVSLDDIGTTRGTANFAIRGLGVNSSIPSIDPAVGVFVDGVYLGTNSGVVFDLFDLDSVEVLRGPQGILFGRNTTGGAVLINTGNPTEDFQYKLRLAADGPVDDDRGGVNTYVQGVVSGPITDTLRYKLGAYFNDDSGYFKNLANNSNHGEAETRIFRGALEWDATSNLTLLGKYDYFTSEGDGPSAQNRGFFSRDSFDFAIDNEGSYDNEAHTFSLRGDMDVAFGDGTITNIFGYRSYEAFTDGDIDSTPFFLFHSTTEFDQEQISNELRYAGTFGNFDVTTGIFYFDQDVAYTEVRDLPPTGFPTFYGGGAQDHTVFGVFGAVDWSLSDQFIINLGLRYSDEEKDAAVTYVRPRPMCSVVDGTCPTGGVGTNPFIPEPSGFTDSDSWSNWAPKVGFQYFTEGGQQIYGAYSKGFRSGGYNFRITDPATFLFNVAQRNGQIATDEEEVDNLEVGFKYASDDGRWKWNLAAYTTQIADMQREVNVASGSGVSQFILNTADADIRGIELDGQIALKPNLILTGNVGTISAEYTDITQDISGDGVVNGADLDLAIPRVPEITYGVGVIYDWDLGDMGLVTSRMNYQYRDRVAYTDSNFGWIQEADMLNANIAWQTPIDGISLSLYGNNLLDEVQAGGDTQLPFPAPLGNGVNRPFDELPALGTFSPLKKGRVVGVELVVRG